MSLALNNNITTNTQNFVSQMLYHMEEICRDHNERARIIKDPESDVSKVNSVLSKGLWYPTEYCQALEKFKQNARLNWMIKNGAPFHGFMPNTFTPIEDSTLPTKRKLFQYKIANGVLPSEALESIQNSVCLIGCDTAMDIAIYRTLQDLLGKARFDTLFASDSSTPLQLGTDNTPRRQLFKRVELLSGDSLQPGDFCHFSNIQHYVAKHPFGPARGYNVIYRGDSQFLGLGLPLECPSTNIDKALLDSFNAPQYPETFFNPRILSYTYGKTLLCNEEQSRAFVASLSEVRLTQEEFDEMPNRQIHALKRTERRMLLSIERPDLDKIKMVVEAPLENINKIFRHIML